ncbi:flagellar hook-associated protein FlgL [Pseudidiomarina andamanensis]|uniref:Flagellar hook-associated protein 3 n=1 Tax=Pseudidiomarina andamanensis TaxID=1940690 RepID=A0AA92IM71_9GAMM|nr:flagellar hook-associated protein FlgL [Pseudidiomarina andamanensis]MDS0218891.1 flagellar hook-associated protein FlgL [Pseudidiomarina andamanensis]QGT96256.1 flagellar hook-associated protein 3 [Pseudidiomarina andamanensis]
MRISTLTMYNQSVSSMNRQQTEFMKIGQQIASGKRIVNISDDPQAMTQAINIGQSKAVSSQFSDARVGVRNALSQEESVLNSVNDVYSRAKTLMVQASSDTLSDADRASVASELRGLYESLIGLGNTRDGNGRYLFGGYQDDTAPFIRDVNGDVSYVGHAEVREQQVDGDRRMAVGHSGDDIFRSVHSSAGYLADAGLTNQGTLQFNGINIVDSNHPDFGLAYDIEFADNAGQMQYRVNGGAWADYNDPTTVALGGIEVELEGAPATGDTLRVARGQDNNMDIFRTFEKALAVLDNAAVTDAQKSQRVNTLRTVMREFDNGMDNVLTTRAEVGARLNELDALDTIGSNRTLAYEQALSDLVDLDYVEAASQYSVRMVGLQAAQKAFVDMKDMSLFKFL